MIEPRADVIYSVGVNKSQMSSFLIGMGMAIDFGGALHLPNYYDYFPESTRRLMLDKRDLSEINWYIVGSYLEEAFRQFSSHEHIELPDDLQVYHPLGTK